MQIPRIVMAVLLSGLGASSARAQETTPALEALRGRSAQEEAFPVRYRPASAVQSSAAELENPALKALRLRTGAPGASSSAAGRSGSDVVPLPSRTTTTIVREQPAVSQPPPVSARPAPQRQPELQPQPLPRTSPSVRPMEPVAQASMVERPLPPENESEAALEALRSRLADGAATRRGASGIVRAPSEAYFPTVTPRETPSPAQPGRQPVVPVEPAPAVADEAPAVQPTPTTPPVAGFERPAPLPSTKQERLAELLKRYMADEITPSQYHSERAQILAEKD